MNMVMLVIDNPRYLDAVLDAWEAQGVSGVTIIESTGINRRRRAQQVGKAFMAGMNRLLGDDVENHYTLFVIVPGEASVQACLRAAEEILGDLNGPNSGVLAAWPLTTAKGVPLEILKRSS